MGLYAVAASQLVFWLFHRIDFGSSLADASGYHKPMPMATADTNLGFDDVFHFGLQVRHRGAHAG